MTKFLLMIISTSLLMLSPLSQARDHSISPEPTIYNVQLTVMIYETERDLAAACNLRLTSDRNVAGCSNTIEGFSTIKTLMPKDWCDWFRLQVLGHEVLHGLGKHHSDEYAFIGANLWPGWASPSCDFVYWE